MIFSKHYSKFYNKIFTWMMSVFRRVPINPKRKLLKTTVVFLKLVLITVKEVHEKSDAL